MSRKPDGRIAVLDVHGNAWALDAVLAELEGANVEGVLNLGDSEDPHPHAMEAGTPHARWGILERTGAGWAVELRATPHDTPAAATTARANGRPDWALWIETGRAPEGPVTA